MIRLCKYAKKQWLWMGIAVLSGFGASYATVAVIELLREMMDTIYEGGFMDTMLPIFTRMAGIVAIGFLCNYSVVCSVGYTGAELLKKLRKDALQSMMNCSPEEMSTQNFGDMMERLSSDVATLAGFVRGYFKDCIYLPILVILYAGYLFALHPMLACACLLPLLILVPVNIKYYKPVKLLQNDYVKKLGLTNNHIKEVFDGIEVIKAYNLQGCMKEKYYNALKITFDLSNQSDLQLYHIEPTSRMIQEIPLAMALCYGGYLVFQGDITIGVLIAYISIIKKLIDPLSWAYQLVVRSTTAMISVRRVFEIIDMPGERLETIKTDIPLAEENILEFSRVSYTYPKSHAPALKEISLTIRRGEKVAFIGQSGGGKSTILKLIANQLLCKEGTVRLCGDDYSTYTPKQIRSQMALISQETLLFPLSIADNIRVGNPKATRTEIEHALRLAECEDFVNHMEHGMDTVLEENGANLSGGQRQRISLARAIVKDAPILLLDEPTAALDKATEQMICQTIEEMAKNKTVITVAHRLDTIKNYDRIFGVEEGKIWERTTL